MACVGDAESKMRQLRIPKLKICKLAIPKLKISSKLKISQRPLEIPTQVANNS